MKLQLIRHATLWLEYAGNRFLVDPMFSDVGVNPPIINTPNDRRNPLVPLPFAVDGLLNPDAVLVTQQVVMNHKNYPCTQGGYKRRKCQEQGDLLLVSAFFWPIWKAQRLEEWLNLNSSP
jgi:hypothetical protein